ncbi:hypothetical protein BC835DRAFT_1423875 [Cytidiella melzeri]|nr:hypothetical protein BC835DRAFT_1423875 [Cytidiella melzeri]
MYANRQAVQVHISNLAAQTGASLFQQTHAPPYFPDLGVRPPPLAYDWVYDKTEDISPTSITTDCSITHAIVEIQDGVGMNAWEATGFLKSSWVRMAVIPAFEKWKFNVGALKLEPMKPWWVLEYVEGNKLAVLERRGW